ncbi:MAG: hypothetical protein J6386_13665 [Candidatus Synoicihabitans palmerolidicus]|nr:hypothetical protein [Candidatus Synoicihabitans palmerolidicus]
MNQKTLYLQRITVDAVNELLITFDDSVALARRLEGRAATGLDTEADLAVFDLRFTRDLGAVQKNFDE